MASKKRNRKGSTGKLRIGDDWNAITIIAMSQSNPLKAMAEFVENSIDANARHITISRGRQHGEPYLRIVDDGDGIPRNTDGMPDFKYVATHICDSIKRQLKSKGARGIQGEFGIGLLSFWTVGVELTLASSGADGKTYQMMMKKGDPSYSVTQKRTLFSKHGTELKIKPLLPGIRQFSGEKIQWYLASELRDRIRQSGVKINVIDRQARKEYAVVPRQFGGRLLHQLPAASCAHGDVYLELYLADADAANQVGLYRSGTRVLEAVSQLEAFQRHPWTAGCLQGIIDAPFLHLTPGTRSGVIHDDAFAALQACLEPIERHLIQIIEDQKKAEEEHASRLVLRTIQKAFKEALLALPAEEYDWFDIRLKGEGQRQRLRSVPGGAAVADEAMRDAEDTSERSQKQFFEFAGPLFSVRISPASCVVMVGKSRTLRAIPRDRSRHLVEDNLRFHWQISEGEGWLENEQGEIVTFHAPLEPGLTKVQLSVTQETTSCEAEALVTVTDSLLPESQQSAESAQGLPGYTYKKAPGELWRSSYDAEQNIIVINNGHRDFVYASRNKALKLRYICRLFAKELVYKNFPGYSPDQLLERMIELTLYTEENLK